MSDFTVINDVSNSMLSLLKANINGLVQKSNIGIDSPADVSVDNGPKVSLYLFQVAENSHLKNQEMVRVSSSGLQFPALPLHLYYLVTAHGASRQSEQQILGRIMQIFHDNSIIRGSMLQGSLSGSIEELIVSLHNLKIEDLHNLWGMIGENKYKLSLIYRVSTALIDSTREVAGDRVISRQLNYYLPE